MVHVRSWAFRAFAVPSVVVLGLVNVGCPGNVSSSATANGGGGNGGSSTNGGGGNAGNGGSGGATCQPETEICDMKDNDCDGQIDNVANPEGCACNDGETQSCYAGPAGTDGVGACTKGSQTCVDGQWAECMGQVLPAEETCNLVDDDCNGAVDDMGQQTCGVGACAVTVTKCVDGVEQPCVPGQPTLEVCDGVDNNCNQIVDESDPTVGSNCMTGSPGVCAAGKTACVDGALVCAGDVMATQETCDGADNDCDGTTDNNIPGTGGDCSTGQLGVCAAGTISCQLSGGSYQVDCFPNVAASPEVCDGLDNDCDGTADNGNPEGGDACDTGQLGICQAGTLNCIGGQVQCTPNAQAAAEVCNGIDDNCDGQADEGAPGAGQPCGCANQGTTACTNGQIVCNGGPVTYFTEDFSDNGAGWTVGQDWAIAPAVAGSCASATTGNDPGTDHSPTADNGIAGVVVGGCYPTTLHGDYCLTSPTVDLSSAAGSVFLGYWRHLHTDYPNYVTSKVQVSSNNGGTWTNVYSVPAGQFQNDMQWVQASFDVTAYKSAQFKVRFCYSTGPSTGIITGGGWSVDDVYLASATCP
ncbi:MAG: MopE-related protein [Polyangiaceae bacterium]